MPLMSRNTPPIFHKMSISIPEIIGVLILSLCIFRIIYFAPNKYSYCDPLGCLLTSQAILSFGTVNLDAYKEIITRYEFRYGYRIMTINGHLFYFYPIGSCIYAIPFVKLANCTGRDISYMVGSIPVYDLKLQNLLSSLIGAGCFLLIYGICRCLLKTVHSIILSLIFVLGSSIASTMGTAFWNFDFEVMFILFSILLILYDAYDLYKLNAYLLSFLLFSAYFCRPTAAIFVGVVAIYIFFRSRKLFIELSVSLCVLFMGSILFSLHLYDQMLPPYYHYHLSLKSETLWIAFYGILLSPGRGLFIYSPYLIVTFFGVCFLGKRLFQSRLTWMAGGWFVLHILAISKFQQWWGGSSFGPRLLTDVFPACMLLTIFVWNELTKTFFSGIRKVAIIAFLCLASISVIIHTYQGLYNPATPLWNVSPNIDEYTEYLFDWRYPQFMASTKLLKERELYHQEKIRLKNLSTIEK